MNHTQLIDDLLNELSYRVGIVDLKNKNQQSIISEILSEWGEYEAKKIIMEFLTEKGKTPDMNKPKADTEGDDKDYTHLGAGIYVRKGDEDKDTAQKYKKDDSGSLKAISDDEYQKTKSDQGEEGEKAAADTPQNQQGGDTQQVEEPQKGTSLKQGGYDKKVEKEDETRKQIDSENDKKKTTDTPVINSKPASKSNNPNLVGKNKKLKKVDSVNEFNTNPKFANDGVSDADFNKNSNIVKTSKQVEFTDTELDKIFGKPRKFPKKYEKVLIRLLNTKKSKDISITDFTDAAGGGTLSSTAGEILTTVGLSIKDDSLAKEFFDKIEEHVKSTKSESIIDVAWVKSARQVRRATHRRYNRMFGNGNWELETMAWDIADEVEALGLDDYKKNKGYSTDTYAKLKVNGESKLDEISLKKSKAANLLNTTTNRVDDIFFKGYATQDELDEMDSLETEYNTISSKQDKLSKERKKEIISRIKKLQDKYNSSIPDDAKVEVTKKKQNKIHEDGLKNNGQSIRDSYNKYSQLSQSEKDKLFRDLELMMGQNFSPKQREQFENVFSQIVPPSSLNQLKELNKSVGLGGDARKVQKTSVMIHGMAKLLGNPAGKTYDDLVENSHKHAEAVATAILSDTNAKAGLLNSIREDFPLKSLMTGEENMTLGDLSADMQTLSKVFGVSDFDKLQENLKVRQTPPPPSIVYSMKGQEDIPVAIINTRPDGIGYGGTWKLEMKIHPDFANNIQTAQTELEPQ